MAKPAEPQTRERLCNALATWRGGIATVSGICEAAGVSRTAVYRYHRDILEKIRQLRGARQSELGNIPCQGKLREENAQLRVQLGQLAALVDHYFRACEEMSEKLQHREAELASLRRSLKERPILIGR